LKRKENKKYHRKRGEGTRKKYFKEFFLYTKKGKEGKKKGGEKGERGG